MALAGLMPLISFVLGISTSPPGDIEQIWMGRPLSGTYFALEAALRLIVFVATATHPGIRSAVDLDVPANPSNQAAPVHASDAARSEGLLRLCPKPR